MNDYYTYLIQIGGEVAAGELNPTSPLQMLVVRCEAAGTLLAVSTDQSGLIGLLRHLHGLGFAILSVIREP